MKKARIAAFCVFIAAVLLTGCRQEGMTNNPDSVITGETNPESERDSATNGNVVQSVTQTEKNNGETDTMKETETSAPAQAEPVKLRIATYNIKHAAEGEDKIAGVIRAMNPDIVGIQEVDYLNTRSGGRNQPKLIAEAAGMPYYEFCRTIDYKGGQYGTLILSKYPITEYETVKLNSSTYEGRAVGHAVIDVCGIRLDFFNTHLSYEDKAVRTVQFEKLAQLLAGCRRFALTGDFNTPDFDEFTGLGAGIMINRTERVIPSFPSGGKPIDNILLSEGFTEENAGRIEESYSDHYPVYADVVLFP